MRRDAHDAGGDLSTAFFGLNRATTLAWLLAWHQLRPLELVLAACKEHHRVEHQYQVERPMASAMSTAPQRPAPSCSFAFRARVPAFDIGNCTFRHGPFHLNVNHILSHHTTPYIQPPPNNAQGSLGRRTACNRSDRLVRGDLRCITRPSLTTIKGRSDLASKTTSGTPLLAHGA